MRKTVVLLILGMACVICATDDAAVRSSIRPYKPSREDEVLQTRIERLEQRCHCHVIDFVYSLAPGDDLVIKIDVRREGKPDRLKSMVMRVSSCRRRFTEAGKGLFSVTDEQLPDGRFFWSFDFDTGAGYGLFCTEYAHQEDGPNSYEAQDQATEKLILRRTSDSGGIDIRVLARICKTQVPLMNPTLDPLYGDDSRPQEEH